MKYFAFVLPLLLASRLEAARYLPTIAVASATAELNRVNPEPEPDPSGVCENCNGTGKVGDGTVFVTCAVCDGTGKKTTLINPALTEAVAKSSSQVSDDAPVDPNFAAGNLKWDAQCGRWLSADGRYAAEPKGKWQARQWRTIPRYASQPYQVKVCSPGRACRWVTQYRQVQVGTQQVEVFGTSQDVDQSLPAEQQPTPISAVGEGLRLLNVRGKTFVEFGCGPDARWCIEAIHQGARNAIGVEIDPEVAESARRYVAQAGLSDRIRIITGDATTAYVQADVGVAYLWPETLEKLRPQIQKLDRFVSYSHDVPGLPMRQVGDLYVYEKPQPVMLPMRPAGAVWGGRVYSGPVCNRRNCSMCNAIRRQLAWN